MKTNFDFEFVIQPSLARYNLGIRHTSNFYYFLVPNPQVREEESNLPKSHCTANYPLRILEFRVYTPTLTPQPHLLPPDTLETTDWVGLPWWGSPCPSSRRKRSSSRCRRSVMTVSTLIYRKRLQRYEFQPRVYIRFTNHHFYRITFTIQLEYWLKCKIQHT